MPQTPAVSYKIVLIPSCQVTESPLPGRVMLTGTPGQGDWDEWGPYWSLGELTPDLAEAFGVPPVKSPEPPAPAVPSAAA